MVRRLDPDELFRGSPPQIGWDRLLGDHWMLDDDGNPCRAPDFVTWSQWFQTCNPQLREDFVGTVRVSTVFLGLDHNFGRGGEPMLWETMVLGGPLDQECQRYSSRAAALAGHAGILAEVRRAVNL